MKELSLAIVCVLTMAAWTSAQQPPPDCPDLVRALQDMMRAVIALHPDVVVILAGTNDIAGNTGPMTDEEIEGTLTSMCDYDSAMIDDRGLLQADLSEDELHPNAKGYAVMAPLADAAVQRALQGPAR